MNSKVVLKFLEKNCEISQLPKKVPLEINLKNLQSWNFYHLLNTSMCIVGNIDFFQRWIFFDLKWIQFTHNSHIFINATKKNYTANNNGVKPCYTQITISPGYNLLVLLFWFLLLQFIYRQFVKKNQKYRYIYNCWYLCCLLIFN